MVTVVVFAFLGDETYELTKEASSVQVDVLNIQRACDGRRE